MIVIKKLVTQNMTLHESFLIIEIKEKNSSYFWIKKVKGGMGNTVFLFFQ